MAIDRMNTGFVQPKVIGAEVARAFADHIIYLRWPPGMRLIEEELCSHFNVSRSPVRDAFQILEVEGLIVRAAWRGVRVAPMSVENLDEIYRCRVVLEGQVGTEAARAANDEALLHLRELLAGMEQASRERNVDAFFEHNVAFTRGLHQASGNRTLMRIVSCVEKQALRYRYLTHQRTHEIIDLVLEGDRKIFEAIAARKPDLARRENVKLIRGAHRVIARVVEEIEPSQWLSLADAETSPA